MCNLWSKLLDNLWWKTFKNIHLKSSKGFVKAKQKEKEGENREDKSFPNKLIPFPPIFLYISQDVHVWRCMSISIIKSSTSMLYGLHFLCHIHCRKFWEKMKWYFSWSSFNFRQCLDTGLFYIKFSILMSKLFQNR